MTCFLVSKALIGRFPRKYTNPTSNLYFSFIEGGLYNKIGICLGYPGTNANYAYPPPHGPHLAFAPDWQAFPYGPSPHAASYPYGSYYPALHPAVAAAAPFGFAYQSVPGGAMVGTAAGLMDGNIPHAPTINGVVEKITLELKTILKRDFNKKMVEVTAYKRFETW